MKLKFSVFLIISTILIFIDQWTKRLAYENLYGKNPVVLINNVLELVYVENRGAAFGILQGKQVFFYILTIIVLVIIIHLLIKLDLTKSSFMNFVFLILIFSGAIGNFIDRVKNKYVVDFIYFKPIDFPVFNFADICITIGCVFMILTLFFTNKESYLN